MLDNDSSKPDELGNTAQPIETDSSTEAPAEEISKKDKAPPLPTATSSPKGPASFNEKPDIRFTQIRYNSGGGKNFFQNVFENIKRDFEKNKEMKENLKKFREEREKLEQSDALKQARKKFENIEKETSGLKESLKGVREKVSETFEEVQKSDIGKKAGEITEELGKTAGKAAEKLSQSTQNISKTASYKTISQGVKAVKDEFDETTLSGATHYKPPAKLRMRSEFAMSSKEDRHVDADDESLVIIKIGEAAD
ncbi:mitochondrial import inner membrane translocase subunit TIM44-like [Mytilus californianus]|uniref:mitochondrial import inner membrane translocase subunit TIM44-like n=1 Tax=Mytilus californianus TaxID=6549 RepID=UPI002245C89E|nr:mitochondrial import inner membrane translocase subunit TIM44-like [Mytilus californianus]